MAFFSLASQKVPAIYKYHVYVLGNKLNARPKYSVRHGKKKKKKEVSAPGVKTSKGSFRWHRFSSLISLCPLLFCHTMIKLAHLNAIFPSVSEAG